MRCILLLVFVVISDGLHAQPGWNYVVPFPYPALEVNDLMVDKSDHVVISGRCFNNDVEFKQGVLIAKMDTLGNILHERLFLDSLGDRLFVDVNNGKMIEMSVGGYAATIGTVSRRSTFLIKLDANLNTLLMREYLDSSYVSQFDYKIREVSGGFLLYGYVQLPDLSIAGCVKRVDYEGNPIWEKLFPTDYYGLIITDLDAINDTTFVVVITEEMAPLIAGNLPSGRSIIHKIDQHGEILQSYYTFPEPEIGYMRKVLARPDGSFITFGLARKYVFISTAMVQSTFSGFDADMNHLWTYNIGSIRSLNVPSTFFDFASTADGGYVGVGVIGFPANVDPRAYGWVYKMSAEGDSLWARQLRAKVPVFESAFGTFYGVGELSSGSLVAGGTSRDSSDQIWCWIVKLTPEGCMDTLFCSPSVSVQHPVLPGGGLQVYPNPAAGPFTVSSPVPLRRVVLWDALGRAAYEQAVSGHATVALQPPPGLAPGCYTLAAYAADGAVFVERVVIN